MKYILYRIETYGIKNISKKISFDFTNQTVYGNTKKNQSRVKAIYGTNGAGKSAFINSIEIYKTLNLDPNYLKQNENIKKLCKLLNKETNSFYFSIIYGFYNSDKVINVFKHQIKIDLSEGMPCISKEVLSVLKDKTINGAYQDIYQVINGDLTIYCNDNLDINSLVKEKTKNLLYYSTLSSFTYETFMIPYLKDIIFGNKQIFSSNSKLLYSMLGNNNFSKNITIFLDEKDIHNEFDVINFDILLEEIARHKGIINNRISPNEDLVMHSKIDDYRKSIKKLCSFLKLFKPDLKDIKIIEKEDKYYYHCYKQMVYENYSIDTDYESAGIQKLMKLFSLIEDVTKGKIVFIDELDDNINGVYINKLIEYLNDLNIGQLCFTLHNLYPMKYLYKYSNAIDFIGETGKVVSWIKNGNYRPYEKYPEGMIEDSPFNIESFDFISIFESEDE